VAPGQFGRDEFARLFSEHARLLWVVAAAHSPRGDAEDVLQSAALAALERLDRFPIGGDFRAWMSQFVRYVASNARRARRSTAGVDDVPERAAPRETVSPNAVTSDGRLDADAAELDDAMRSALDELDPDARACLLLRVVLELPGAEVARALDLPENTVASHVHRARAALRERLASAQTRTLSATQDAR